MNSLKKFVAIAIVLTTFVGMFGSFGTAQAVISAECWPNQNDITTLNLAKCTDINELLEVVAKLAAISQVLQGTQPTTLPAGVPVACTGIAFTRNLSQRMSGTDVKCLQAILNLKPETKIAESGAGSLGNETIYFGSLTKAAVKKFQKIHIPDVLAEIGYPDGTGFVGSATRAKLAELLKPVVTPPIPPTACTKDADCLTGQVCQLTTGTCVAPAAVTVPTVPTVMLDPETPAGTYILAGEANKAVTKIKFLAGPDADVTINGFTVRSYGTARVNNADIAVVKIFDGTKQIGLTMQQVAGLTNFTFAPAITITKAQEKILSIVVDVAAVGSIPSATVKMGIEAATNIMGTTFAGTFPIVGYAFTIVAGGALGQVIVTPGVPVPFNAVAVGTKDVVLGNFIVAAGTNEDVKITQFNATYGGPGPGGGGAGGINGSTALDSDVVNVRIKIDGVLTGTSANFATRRATIDFLTPVPIVRGTSKVFQVIGDIAGAGRRIELSSEIGSIFGLGATSGVGVSGPAARFNLGLINIVGFGPGTLAVSVSSASPSGATANVVRSITPQILGVYNITALGEDVLINTVNLRLRQAAAAATGSIFNVGLYNEAGTLQSNQINFLAADLNVPITQTFTLNWLVPANTIQKLYIKGTTSTLTTAAGVDVINAQLALVGTDSIVGTGMASSGQAGANNITSASFLALPALTINATATFLAVADPSLSMYNQAVLGPTPQVTLGYLKVTAQRESQDYRALLLTGNVTGAANLAAMVSDVALFDGDYPVTLFVAPVVNNVTFTTAQTALGTTFTLGTAKTLKIVANVLLPAVEGATVRWTIAAADGNPGTLDGLQTVGKASGQIAENAAVVNLITNVGAFNETGTYIQRTNVLEIKKDVISPTGNVRGTFVNHGIWDVDARGAAATLDVSAITFTSTVGLPATATAAMFRLYDYTNSTVIPATITVTPAAGTVAFTGIPDGNLRVTAGSPLQIALQVTTTDPTVWPINSQIQWTIRQQANVVVGAMGTAVAATDPDFGTAIALPTLALGAGAVAKTGAAGVAFVYGTDRLYIASGGTGFVAVGDVRLAVTAADVAAGRTVGSTVVAGAADIGTAIIVPTLAIGNVGAVGMTGDATAAFVLGTNAAYIKGNALGATVGALDVRVVAGGTLLTGLNWQGGVGYGGVTVSIPANANFVTLP